MKMSWGGSPSCGLDVLEDNRIAWDCELCGCSDKDCHNVGTFAGEENIFVCDQCHEEISRRKLRTMVGAAVRKRHRLERQEKLRQKELRRIEYEELKKEFG